MKFILTLAVVSCFVLIASALPKLNTTVFINEALAAHNKYRKLHNAPPLKINEDLNLLAQSIANIKAIDDSYTSHLPKYLDQEIGINVAQTVENPKSKFGSGYAASESWYNGAIDYVMGVKNINSDDFAQLIWKGTKQVGFGVAKSKDKGHFVAVATYFPKGNIDGEYEKNVIVGDNIKVL